MKPDIPFNSNRQRQFYDFLDNVVATNLVDSGFFPPVIGPRRNGGVLCRVW